MDDVCYKQSLNTGLLYLAFYCRPVKQMFLYFSIHCIFFLSCCYQKKSKCLIPVCAFSVHHSTSQIHRFGLASAEKSPVGWHCSHCHKIGNISSPTIPREFMSDQIRMWSFCVVNCTCKLQNPGTRLFGHTPLHGLPCSWWLHRHLWRLWYSVAFARKIKERLFVFSCMLCTCKWFEAVWP